MLYPLSYEGGGVIVARRDAHMSVRPLVRSALWGRLVHDPRPVGSVNLTVKSVPMLIVQPRSCTR